MGSLYSTPHSSAYAGYSAMKAEGRMGVGSGILASTSSDKLGDMNSTAGGMRAGDRHS